MDMPIFVYKKVFGFRKQYLKVHYHYQNLTNLCFACSQKFFFWVLLNPNPPFHKLSAIFLYQFMSSIKSLLVMNIVIQFYFPLFKITKNYLFNFFPNTKLTVDIQDLEQ